MNRSCTTIAGLVLLLTTTLACSGNGAECELEPSPDAGDEPHVPSDGGGGPGDAGGSADGRDGGADGRDGGDDSGTEEVAIPVELLPQVDGAADERVNFTVPFPRGHLETSEALRVQAAGDALPAYVRPFAWYPDGSVRSVQIQVDVDVQELSSLAVVIGAEASAGALEPVAVKDTLVREDGTAGPRVLAVLPPGWLVSSGLVGPAPASEPATGPTLGAWSDVCDYERYDTARFLSESDSKGVWLYDRPAALYRLHAITGEASPLLSAYREAHIYRTRMSGSGSDTRIGVPSSSSDLKYHYTQGMAITYLLTGDERLRERVEDVAARASDLWRPRYEPGGRFWTERHAGFALLAYVWAARVSRDRRDHFLGLADEAVTAYRDGQLAYPADYSDPDARCFSHRDVDAGESYGYEGCSPWLSAILADGLEEYAAERGGDRAAEARDSIVMLGRMLARHGRDSDGKPFMWLAGDGSHGTGDPYDEHWGESAYVIAMAWHHDGRRDPALRRVAEELIDGLAARGVAPHTRSFNWQCRGAPLTPLYLDS